jgi:hypothetical protein
MTLAEVISKEDISHSSESSNPETKKKRLRLNRSNKSHQDGAFKKLQTSVLDLLHVHHSVDNLENKDIQPPQQQQQQKESAPRHPSIIKSSDIARVLSKKSVTFASVFDPVDNENDTVRRFILQLIKFILIRFGNSNQLLTKKRPPKKILLLLSLTVQSMIKQQLDFFNP